NGAHSDTHSFPTRRSSDLAYHTIVAKGAFWQRGYGMNLINGKLNLVKVGIGDVTSSVLLSAGTWQHVAITWNAATSEVKFYLNGARESTRLNASHVATSFA